MKDLKAALKNYLNEAGQVTSWPSKPKLKKLALLYLAEGFSDRKNYSEKEVNDILNGLHTFEDAALLRRELYMKGLLNRETDGSRYWRTLNQLPKSWSTKSLSVADASSSDLTELQKVYEECG